MWGIAIYALIFSGFVAILIRNKGLQLDAIPRSWLVFAFIAKAIVGGMFYWVYTTYYTQQSTLPDAFRYVHDAQLIADVLPNNPNVFSSIMLGYASQDPAYQHLTEQMIGWHSGYLYGLTNDCSTIIRLNVPIALFSGRSFMVHALIFSIASFIGCLLLFLAFKPYLNKYFQCIAFAVIFLSPTQLFWTCSPTKEAALMPVFGGLFYLLSMMHQQKFRLRHLWWFILIIPGLVFIKQYVLYALIPGVLYFLVQRGFNKIRPIYVWCAVMLLCGIIADNAHHVFIGGDFLYVINKKLTDFNNLAAIQQAGSHVYVAPTHTWVDFGLNYPAAFAQSYLRPWIWECKSWIYVPFAIENTLLIGLVLITLWKRPSTQRSVQPLIGVMFASILVMAGILGNTVPILGAIVRYRTPGLLLLCLLCLILLQGSFDKNSPEKNSISKPLGN